ncbi:MAG TPA: radical SAM family heme chaperone HemW [Leptospiraceae bacterium]|nr:radical SAM family heme chaperone HemW [Leptospiraceae bacterium]HMW03617.1 radical SAM family heme chaperone HemW [Leptospiraceae bacterium]HMX31256.1 radical SAM family heme chaperone HemW [Leptospiraceae bacterium]HMY29462.1 radical SAM family heme chaperone HemW [Leptospiraceae bacterium]HMZ64749.1 radical SAM family heme chaperone HemW [Leptospiraceae bacterium]
MEIATYRKGFAGLYLHFPYCIHKCSYCDFYSVGIGKTDPPNQDILFNNYKKEFLLRIQIDPTILDYTFDTIFIGGGTPSLANLDLLKDFIEWVRSYLKFSPNTEFTMEMNPEDISEEKLVQLFNLGVNRVNAGIQSFDKNLLATLDRYNDEDKYSSVLRILSSSPIKRFGIDLIYGIPGQTKDMFLSDLQNAISKKVTHISLYSLTMEKGTEYYRKVKRKESLPPNEELQIEILNSLPTLLKEKEFRQYEVSNYALLGEESRHNLKYWTMEKYLSLGPGAHGFTDNGRYFNHRSIEKYLSGEFGRNYEKSESLDELALCLFRLFLPIDLRSFFILIPDHVDDLEKLISIWQTQDLCTYKQGIFQWRQNAIIRLDDLILQVSELVNS